MECIYIYIKYANSSAIPLWVLLATRAHTHAHTHTHTHTQSLSLSRTHTHAHTSKHFRGQWGLANCQYQLHLDTHTHTNSLSLFLSHSHAHTRTHTYVSEVSGGSQILVPLPTILVTLPTTFGYQLHLDIYIYFRGQWGLANSSAITNYMWIPTTSGYIHIFQVSVGALEFWCHYILYLVTLGHQNTHTHT